MEKNLKGSDFESSRFDTEDEEFKVVREYLRRIGCENIRYIGKCKEADYGDICVEFENGTYTLFEIKREDQTRFKRYGQYGIDLISRIEWKDHELRRKWKGRLFSGTKINELLNDINCYNMHFKWGKVCYSYADVMLFYIVDKQTGEYVHIKAYDAKKMLDDDFYHYLLMQAQFAVNKFETDTYDNDSAVWFIEPAAMSKYEIRNADDLWHNGDIMREIMKLAAKNRQAPEAQKPANQTVYSQPAANSDILYLYNDYKDNAYVKKAGAKFDGTRKLWYVRDPDIDTLNKIKPYANPEEWNAFFCKAS